MANPLNWRIHPRAQGDALEGVLDDVGWVDTIKVNRRTGFVVDGHLRVTRALERGQKSVPVAYLDLSEEEEAEVLATIDPIGAMAAADTQKQAELLEGIHSEQEAVQELIDQMAMEAERAVLHDASPNEGRAMGDSHVIIRAALYAPQIAVFEQAIKATGETNRGRAIIAICEDYLERNGYREATGLLDAAREGIAATQSA